MVSLTTNTSGTLGTRFGILLDQTDLKGSFFEISGRWECPVVLLFYLFGLLRLQSQLGETEGIPFSTEVLLVDVVDFIFGSCLSGTTVGLYGVV